MANRINIFISHSFQHLDKYQRILEFLGREGIPTANYSVPVWGQLTGTEDERRAGLQERVRSCSYLLVLLTPKLHKSSYITLEIETAKAYRKPIIGIFPHGHNNGRIPQMLDGEMMHAIGWRAGSLRRVMEGGYPVERRTFNIAEVRERVELALLVASAAGVVSVLVAGWSMVHFQRLCESLRAQGVAVVKEDIWPHVAVGGVLGATAAVATVAAIGGDVEDMLLGAAIGAISGAAIAVTRRIRIRTTQVGELTQVDFHPACSPLVDQVR